MNTKCPRPKRSPRCLPLPASAVPGRLTQRVVVPPTSPQRWCWHSAHVCGGIEVCTLTDAHRLDQGVHGERRKDSRASITEWNNEISKAWEALVTRHNAIWNRDGRNFAISARPEKLLLLVEQSRSPIARSSMSSAWQRFIRVAISEDVIEECERFSMHGLKHRGVTDTKGNRGDKQHAAGHKSPTTTGRYDHDMPVVKPTRRR